MSELKGSDTLRRAEAKKRKKCGSLRETGIIRRACFWEEDGGVVRRAAWRKTGGGEIGGGGN